MTATFDHDGHAGAGLSLYLMGALPEPEAVAIDRHLSGCEHCQAELSRLSVATFALAVIEPDEARRLLTARPRHRPGRSRAPALVRLAAVAAVVASIAGFAVGVAIRSTHVEAPVAVARADDVLNGVRLVVNATSTGDGVAVSAVVDGLRPQETYAEYVVTRDGRAHLVGQGPSPDGSVTVDQQVALPIQTLAYFTVVGSDGTVVLLAWFGS